MIGLVILWGLKKNKSMEVCNFSRNVGFRSRWLYYSISTVWIFVQRIRNRTHEDYLGYVLETLFSSESKL